AAVLTVVAVGAAALTATGLLTGTYAPATLLSRTAGTGLIVAVTAVGVAVAIAATVSGRRVPRTAGGLLGGLLAALLVTANGRIDAWEGLIMLAIMFAGTAVHRAEHGQISRRAAAVTAGVVLAGALGTGTWQAAPYGWKAQVAWCLTVLAAAVTFAAAWRWRHRRFPRWATGLGTISFSVYLLHPLLLMVAAQFLDISGREDVIGLAFFVLVLLAVSWASQRWIEAPAQRLGRRLTRPPRPDTSVQPHALAS
ncbi:MAG: acyltransferase family protein, partial [Spirillospora sp.]